ncbi:hypothetical protein EG68_09996 [Paragonimus skrjabini miyazakii]|uniref:Lsm14-like N-terminal domain-containing protein n=1 Tax=Paragonimus skrjabini miyazakii TaxID=59628 RepID=A0A8S9YM75_9TREM|nr:hypothetical protein EG68_09996 [Paragonimus skrjabini miyazakii]
MHENCIKIKSKAGFEYTGILHSIDTKNSTVTLKRVRLSDTSNTDFIKSDLNNIDYVIFRGGDIEDVQLSVTGTHDIMPTHDDAIVRLNLRSKTSLTDKCPQKSEVVNSFPNLDLAKEHKHDPAIVSIDNRTLIVPHNESYQKPSGKNYDASFQGQMSQSSDAFSVPVVTSINQSHTTKTINTSNTIGVTDNITLSKRARSHSVITNSETEKQSETLKGRSQSLDLMHSVSVRFNEQKNDLNPIFGTRAYDRRRSFYDHISTAPTSGNVTNRSRDPPNAASPYGVPTHRTQRKSLNFNHSFHNTLYPMGQNLMQPTCFPITHHQSQQPCNQFTYYAPYSTCYPPTIYSYSHIQPSLSTYHPNWQHFRVAETLPTTYSIV